MNENSATLKPSQKFPRNSQAYLDNILGNVVYVNDDTGIVRLEVGHWKAKVHSSELKTVQEHLDTLRVYHPAN